MDFMQFPELPFVAGTPIRQSPSIPQQKHSEGLKDALCQSSEPFLSEVWNVIRMNGKTVPEQGRQWSEPVVLVPQVVSTPPIALSPQQIGRDAFKAPGLPVRSNLIDQIGAMTNLTKTHPEIFEHMLQPSQGKVSTMMVLDVTSPAEDEEDQGYMDVRTDVQRPRPLIPGRLDYPVQRTGGREGGWGGRGGGLTNRS